MEKTAGKEPPAFWWKSEQKEAQVCSLALKPGYLCPECGQGRLDYDGLFLLTCPVCGYVADSGVFT